MRTHGTTSRSEKCAFCYKKTSTYWCFGQGIEIVIFVCRHHEDIMRHNKFSETNKEMKRQKSNIKRQINLLYGDDIK